MRILGVRCSPKDFAYCVIEGTKTNPKLVHYAEVQFPKGYAKPLSLKWLMQEVDDLLRKHSVEAIAIKRPEGLAARDKYFVERTEFETVFMLVGALRSLKPISKKIKATIAKDLGAKGKAHYLTTIDTSVIPAFSQFSDKLREAILVAWSELQ
jgi:hypothetical protein